ncbi:MAG: ChaN family lipoprotein [Pseudomonadota bacterium]|nr:ChaN family lipoprotein [Pseudomonadota bacterium]
MSIRAVKQLHKNIYRKVKLKAQVCAGDDKSINAYSKKFERSLPREFKNIDQSEFFNGVATSKIILYGDFHTLKQSQKGFIQLIQALSRFHPQRKRAIALETFKASDQVLLDMYMKRKISERAFLRKIRYERTWGFPWKNYSHLLTYARKEGIPVFGINTDGNQTLKQRDHAIADVLAALSKRGDDYQIMCLVGEYHLADQLLPTILTKKAGHNQISRVVTNIDQYYFHLNYVQEFRINHYLLLKKNLYCIMDTPPWIKWQSYTFWEELREQKSALATSADEYNEISIDLDDYMLSLVSDLLKFMRIQANPVALTRFNVLYGSPESIVKQAQQKKIIPPQNLKTAVVRMALDGYYYVSSTRSILIASVSPNNLAEAAGQYIYDTLSQAKAEKSEVMNFYQRVVRFALSVLCSLIINPKRKLTNYYKYVETARSGTNDEQKLIAKEVLRFDNWMQFRVKARDGKIIQHLTRTVRMDNAADLEISRSLGKIIGVRLYREVIKHTNTPARVHTFFKWGKRPVWQVVADMYRFFV